MFTTVLFDLDGTLTDPYMGITNSLMYALERMGYEVPPREELASFIGPPLISEYRRRFGMTEEKAREGVRLYREYFAERGIFENELIDGAEELLAKLKSCGKRVYLATSKPREFAERILEHFGIAGYFDFVGASTMDGSINEKHEVIADILERTGARPEECLMVGDRFHDIVGAHRFGIKCCAVLCGFGSREEFARYGADYVVETLSGVWDLVQSEIGEWAMEKFIITIARGYGSGGRTIGKMLSERLGIPFWDRDLIKLASEESGINEALFGQSDEKTKAGVFSKMNVYTGGEKISPEKKAFTNEENLFSFQAETIKRLAEEKSCIIVGRCADYVLKGMPGVIRVFVYADVDSCVKNVAEVKGITNEKEALKMIASTDKERAAYYKAHTGREWIDARNYDLCLNSGELGFEKCVRIISEYVKIRLS